MLRPFARLVRKFAYSHILRSARVNAVTRFRPSLEALDAREVPAAFTWRGMASTDATNPMNWSGGSFGTLPGQYDTLLFSSQPGTGGPMSPPTSTSAPSCTNLSGTFAGIEITSAYTNTITFSGAVTVGGYSQAGGAISQPSS